MCRGNRNVGSNNGSVTMDDWFALAARYSDNGNVNGDDFKLE